ncbi:MAG TPA: zf-HC2 domain-containing protein [Candidatus Hydrogenedentes bacterium]|nr:zf-HC2 domain-containing protein [Candidatus Hydrogenedentota bacterium]HNT87953.1 zf-HC2 domain-containing protein [Candidatus Hydrogenedentota bacterium]
MSDEREEIRELFSAYLDGELDAEARARFEERVTAVPELREELDAWRRVDGLYRGLAPVRAPEELEARVLDELRGRRIRFRRPRVAPVRMWPMLAAAACFLVVAGLMFFQFSPAPSRTHLASDKAAPAAKAEKDGLAASEGASRAAPGPEAAYIVTLDMPVREDSPTAESPVPPAVKEADALPAPDADSVRQRAGGHTLEGAVIGAVPERRRDLDVIGYATPPEPSSTAAEPAAPIPAPKPPPAAAESVVPAPPPPPPAPQAAVPLRIRAGALDRAEASAPAAKMAEALGARGQEAVVDAEAPSLTAVAPETARQVAAGRVFGLFDDTWRQREYAGEPFMQARRDTTYYDALKREHAEVEEIAALGPRVLFKVGERWYLLLPARAQ